MWIFIAIQLFATYLFVSGVLGALGVFLEMSLSVFAVAFVYLSVKTEGVLSKIMFSIGAVIYASPYIAGVILMIALLLH